jgi:NTE family protein
MVCDKIIGSSVCPHEERTSIKGLRNVGSRCLQLAIWNTVLPRLKECNIALEIEESYQFNMFDLKQSDKLFDIGYNSVISRLPEIRNKILGA